MHAGLMPNGKVFFLDKVEKFTQLKLPNGKWAYSAEYDPKTRRVVPLAVPSLLTVAWFQLVETVP